VNYVDATPTCAAPRDRARGAAAAMGSVFWLGPSWRSRTWAGAAPDPWNAKAEGTSAKWNAR
jgi:hypothetical protein